VRSGLGIGFLGNYAALDPDLVALAGPPAHTITPLHVGALRVLHDDPSVSAVLDWVQFIFERFGDPWFRKALIDMENLQIESLVPNKDILDSLLAGHKLPT